MEEKGSALLEIKGAALFVWDRKRWCWNKIKPDTCRCVRFLISELSTHSATGAKVLAPAIKGRYHHYLINLISITRHSTAPKGMYFYRSTGRLQGFIIIGGEAPTTSGQPNLFHLAPF
ncbi:hypothetical protein [Dialister succinatiphilus]|uniref:hypothetical protein n=1 Tax=Dialister succinatiphilus TaxID=487173 RepID=UPI003F801EA1